MESLVFGVILGYNGFVERNNIIKSIILEGGGNFKDLQYTSKLSPAVYSRLLSIR